QRRREAVVSYSVDVNTEPLSHLHVDTLEALHGGFKGAVAHHHLDQSLGESHLIVQRGAGRICQRTLERSGNMRLALTEHMVNAARDSLDQSATALAQLDHALGDFVFPEGAQLAGRAGHTYDVSAGALDFEGRGRTGRIDEHPG